MTEHSAPEGSAPIFIVSGGTGASGAQLVRTVLAQFQGASVPVIVSPQVHEVQQVQEIVAQAAEQGGTIVHTLVSDTLRHALISFAQQKLVFQVDLVGALITHVSNQLKQKPLGQPGLYRQLQDNYFRRIDAIEYTVAHDDGKRTEDLKHADIILVGLSRVGKTPLSMYLCVQGWKVANVPYVPSVPLPSTLFEVDSRRVVGLSIEAAQLLLHRRSRQDRIGMPSGEYVSKESIVEECRAANHLFFRQKWTVVDTTDKPIESSADEIVSLITRKLGRRAETDGFGV